MEKLDILVEYLKKKFNPVEAIILHGSRASGFAREHSDWDFFVLVDYDADKSQVRDNVAGEEIEFVTVKLPVTEDHILDTFGVKLRYATVVYDAHGKGKEILDMVQGVYKKGPPEGWLTKDEFVSIHSFLQSTVNGMRDSIDDAAMFMKKYGNFYPRIINNWYRVKEKTFSENVYFAVPYIKEKDTEFFTQLEKVYSYETSPKEKTDAAQMLVDLLFPRK